MYLPYTYHLMQAMETVPVHLYHIYNILNEPVHWDFVTHRIVQTSPSLRCSQTQSMVEDPSPSAFWWDFVCAIRPKMSCYVYEFVWDKRNAHHSVLG